MSNTTTWTKNVKHVDNDGYYFARDLFTLTENDTEFIVSRYFTENGEGGGRFEYELSTNGAGKLSSTSTTELAGLIKADFNTCVDEITTLDYDGYEEGDEDVFQFSVKSAVLNGTATVTNTVLNDEGDASHATRYDLVIGRDGGIRVTGGSNSDIH